MADDQASNKPKRTLSATLTPVSGTPAPAGPGPANTNGGTGRHVAGAGARPETGAA